MRASSRCLRPPDTQGKHCCRRHVRRRHLTRRYSATPPVRGKGVRRVILLIVLYGLSHPCLGEATAFPHPWGKSERLAAECSFPCVPSTKCHKRIKSEQTPCGCVRIQLRYQRASSKERRCQKIFPAFRIVQPEREPSGEWPKPGRRRAPW